MPTFRKRDAKTLPKGKCAKVRIPLYYQGHVYREGSRIRVIVSRPRRRPAGLGVRRDAPDGTPWVAVALAQSSRRGSSCRSAGRRGADRPTGVPGAPRRALPHYPPFTNENFQP